MVSQTVIAKRIGGPLLYERLSVAVIVGLLMVPSLDVRANLILLVVVLVLVGALMLETRRSPMATVES
ncbi:hypothetical protein HQ535_06905 [bacterium]|nr:hypothetical protein [bacterium]